MSTTKQLLDQQLCNRDPHILRGSKTQNFPGGSLRPPVHSIMHVCSLWLPCPPKIIQIFLETSLRYDQELRKLSPTACIVSLVHTSFLIPYRSPLKVYNIWLHADCVKSRIGLQSLLTVQLLQYDNYIHRPLSRPHNILLFSYVWTNQERHRLCLNNIIVMMIFLHISFQLFLEHHGILRLQKFQNVMRISV
jgi:hypothetical protein